MKRNVLFLVCLLSFMVVGYMAISGLQYVEYKNSLIHINSLKTQTTEFHCVQRLLGPPLTSLSSFIPRFICFDTVKEADTWMAEHLLQ